MFPLLILCILIILTLGQKQTYTTSGLSSGAFFTVQIGVAYSSEVTGIGVVAGGAYYCAEASETTALTACMSVPAEENLSKLESDTVNFASQGLIDPVDNIKNQKVYLYSGTRDTTVETGVVSNCQKYFQHFGAQTKMDTSQASAHGFVTNFYGNKCSSMGEPYIQNCDYDLAEKILQYLYDNTLNPPISESKVPYNNVIEINQAKFIPKGSTATSISLQTKAYAYVPTNCSIAPMPSRCKLHVAFHGCEQDLNSKINVNTEFNDTYVRDTGYNSMAESNNIIILYPQANSNLISNPNGCWDWWGYNTKNYAFNTGKQMETVHNMIWYILGNGGDNTTTTTSTSTSTSTTTTTSIPGGNCLWSIGSNKLNLTQYIGQTLSVPDPNNPKMFYALSPCDNTELCNNIIVNGYYFNVTSLQCDKYLSIYENGKITPKYDSTDKIWQFIYTNGETCNSLQSILQVYWVCDPTKVNTAEMVYADKNGQCGYEMYINSSNACD